MECNVFEIVLTADTAEEVARLANERDTSHEVVIGGIVGDWAAEQRNKRSGAPPRDPGCAPGTPPEETLPVLIGFYTFGLDDEGNPDIFVQTVDFPMTVPGPGGGDDVALGDGDGMRRWADDAFDAWEVQHLPCSRPGRPLADRP